MRHTAAAQPCVGECATHQSQGGAGEEQAVRTFGDAQYANEHQRRPGDVGEERPEVERDHDDEADTHGLPQHPRVPRGHAREMLGISRVVLTFGGQRFIEGEPRRDRERRGTRGEHAVDRAPPAERRDADADGWRNHRRDTGREIDVRLAHTGLRAGEQIAHHRHDDHEPGTRPGSHQQPPHEQGAQRGRPGGEDPAHGVERGTGQQHGPPSEVVGDRSRHERRRGEADHEGAQRERGAANGDAKGDRRISQDGQAHVGGKRGQRCQPGQEQREPRRCGRESAGRVPVRRRGRRHPRKLVDDSCNASTSAERSESAVNGFSTNRSKGPSVWLAG